MKFIDRLSITSIILGLGWFTIAVMQSCAENHEAPPALFMEASTIDYTIPDSLDQIIMASATPCDSIYYEPVAWGGMLRILPRTISHGQRRGFEPHWQAKGFAWQLIGPTRYQQDSTRERVVFADSDTIRYTDTFYICRKKML